MKVDRRNFIAGSAAATAVAVAAPSVLRAQAGVIKIGEINSYTAQPAFLNPYRNGWTLALEQINAKGGAMGRKIETIHRDDGGKPEDSVRHAGELINAEKVDLLAGGFLSNVGLAISDFANQNKRLYVASEPLTDALVWAQRQPLHVPPAALDLHAGRHAGGGSGQAQDQDLGLRGAELRVRPILREVVQGAADEGQAGRVVRGRAVPGARQDRRRRHRAGAGSRQARGHLQCDLCRRPHQLRASGQHARAVRGSRGGQHADRRTGVSRSAGRGSAEGLDRDRLSACRDQDARAHGVL